MDLRTLAENLSLSMFSACVTIAVTVGKPQTHWLFCSKSTGRIVRYAQPNNIIQLDFVTLSVPTIFEPNMISRPLIAANDAVSLKQLCILEVLKHLDSWDPNTHIL